MTARAKKAMDVFNEIPSKQNDPRMMELLRAKNYLYDFARALFGLKVALSVVAPALMLVFGLVRPSFLPDAAVYGVLALALELILERGQKSAVIRGAKVQELFDIELYGLEWQRQTVGEKPAPEDVVEWARHHPGSAGLRDWYACEVGELPLPLARIACQRSNGWWDSRMRRRYGHFLIGLAVAAVLIVMLGGVFGEGKVITAFEVLFALSPIIVWSLRDGMKQLKLARERESIQERAEEIWYGALGGNLTGQQLDEASYQLQARLYTQRKINAPIIA